MKLSFLKTVWDMLISKIFLLHLVAGRGEAGEVGRLLLFSICSPVGECHQLGAKSSTGLPSGSFHLLLSLECGYFLPFLGHHLPKVPFLYSIVFICLLL